MASTETASGEATYLDAIHDALGDALRDDDRVLLLGEDIGRFGGAFGVTRGLLETFGPERVIDTPISEEGFVGAAFGLAWMGERPVVELQFADFAVCAYDQSDRLLFSTTSSPAAAATYAAATTKGEPLGEGRTAAPAKEYDRVCPVPGTSMLTY
mgnify:CR=1 FL=1